MWIASAAFGLQPMQDPITIQNDQAPLLSVNRAEFALPALPLADPDKLDRLLRDVEARVYQAPRNATIGPSGGIVPEQPGRRLDRSAFTDRFYAAYFGQGPAFLDVPFSPLYPKVDAELLATIREKPIGHYVTYFNPGNKNRAHNIKLAAQTINNYVVFPSESFSFNRIVGVRTRNRGYLRAPVIVRGEMAEDIGGGICQVSSTLFNAVDRAGLQILARYSHSRHVPYVPPGRDATVSWGGPDFAFRNPYNQPILIRALASGGRMFVSIYSSDVVNYKPREVPGMSKRLPEEIRADSGDEARESSR
nr:VanW family protein [Cohnella sp. CFH 77786]